jgi:hypothetical protein
MEGKYEKRPPFPNGLTLNYSSILSFIKDQEQYLSSRFPLLRYSILWWPEHARLSEKEDALLNLSLSFFSSKYMRQIWIRYYWLINMPSWHLPVSPFNLINISAFFGLKMIAKSIVCSKNLTKQTHRDTVNSKSINEMAPLHWAARNGHPSVAKLLIDHGADLNTRGYGLPPLIWAVRNDHKDLAKLLLDHNAEINKMGYGMTALHCASWEGREGMVQLLLDHGADTSARTLSHTFAPSWTEMTLRDLSGFDMMERASINKKDINR